MAHRNPGKADGRSHALRRHDNIVGYLFMLPALLFFCCFIIIPMLTGFVTSLFDYTMKTPVSMETFVGLRNYAELFTTPTFYRALLNTLLIVVVAVPTVTAFSLWVASDARGTAFVFSLCVLSARGHGHRGGRGRVEMDVRCL